jgi:hypothetical protein
MAAAQPRFPLNEIAWWADHYAYADDAEVESTGRTAGQRGLVYEAGVDRGCPLEDPWQERPLMPHELRGVGQRTSPIGPTDVTQSRNRGRPVHGRSSARFLCIDLVSSVVGRSFLRPRP